MNKKLLALAVAGATFAPAAMAQTANPVTLYGRVYAMFESVKANGASGTVGNIGSRNRVSDQSSLLGVRGTEDLGGGLKAFFQLETAFKPDQNDSTFAARNSGVGLQGDWGSVILGRWDTPFKTTTIAMDVYGDLTAGGLTGVVSDRTNFDRREQNAVQYWSPTIGGFAFRGHYSANEAKTQPATSSTQIVNPNVISWSVTYTQGPIYAGYTWERHKDTYKSYLGAVGNVQGGEEKGQALFGSVTFGPVKVGLMGQKFKKNSGIGGQTVTDQKATLANITYTLGKNQIAYQYMKSKDGDLTTASLQPDCHSSSIGYFYNFTRRTTFVAQYVDVKNNAAARCNFGSNTLTLNSDTDPKAIAAGFRHVF